jgi:hypothetical protein
MVAEPWQVKEPSRETARYSEPSFYSQLAGTRSGNKSLSNFNLLRLQPEELKPQLLQLIR